MNPDIQLIYDASRTTKQHHLLTDGERSRSIIGVAGQRPNLHKSPVVIAFAVDWEVSF